MVDYMQKAADLIDKEPVRKSDWTREGIMKRVLATTLEALDKAEAERDALTDRKTLNTIIARHFAPVVPDLGECIVAGNRVCDDILALLQPEPDPLVEKIISEVGAAQMRDPNKPWHEHMRELFRHGLAVKEVG